MNDLENVVDGVLRLLLSKRELIEDWNQRTLEAVGAQIGPQEAISKRDRLVEAIEELVRTVDFSTQTFIDAGKLFHHNDDEFNRDASLIFSVRLQLGRLDEKSPIASLEPLCRRLTHLARIFPSRFQKSSSCQVPHTFSFASSLCEMVFKVEGLLRQSGVVKTEIIDKLYESADCFNSCVVAVLQQWKSELKPATPPRPRSTTPKPRPMRKREPLSMVQHSAGGFICSPYLTRARERLVRVRSSSAPTPKKNALNSGPKGSAKRDAAIKMETKWGEVLKAGPVLEKSLAKEDPNAIAARRVSAQVVRELRNALAAEHILLLKD